MSTQVRYDPVPQSCCSWFCNLFCGKANKRFKSAIDAGNIDEAIAAIKSGAANYVLESDLLKLAKKQTPQSQCSLHFLMAQTLGHLPKFMGQNNRTPIALGGSNGGIEVIATMESMIKNEQIHQNFLNAFIAYHGTRGKYELLHTEAGDVVHVNYPTRLIELANTRVLIDNEEKERWAEEEKQLAEEQKQRWAVPTANMTTDSKETKAQIDAQPVP